MPNVMAFCLLLYFQAVKVLKSSRSLTITVLTGAVSTFPLCMCINVPTAMLTFFVLSRAWLYSPKDTRFHTNGR